MIAQLDALDGDPDLEPSLGAADYYVHHECTVDQCRRSGAIWPTTFLNHSNVRDGNQRTSMSYDIIGDVHGHADRLEALLKALGYEHRNGAWRHLCRSAIFVGDLIDRGPGQIRTLELVRAMKDAGSARVAMGNHELNAIAWATPDPWNDGHYLRARHGKKGEKNRHQHEAFLAEVRLDSAEHRTWTDWFLDLPIWIEEPGFRVVHACWSPQHVEALRPQLRHGERLTTDLVEASSRKGSPMHAAVDTLLKGVEVDLPAGRTFTDKDGQVRGEIRTRWWNPALATYRDAYIGPSGVEMPDIALDADEHIPEPDRPTFIGHYWFDPAQLIAPASKLVACVDFSAAKGGPMVAYRFDGESELSAEKFVAA
jgi:hypothetical protein